MARSEHDAPSLLRALGLGTAMAVVVGNVIGSGIFLKPGTIAGEGLGVGMILTAWVVGGALCILGALCFAELAAMLPRAGGLIVYLRQAYGPAPAFLFGWNELFFNRPGSIGALSVAFVGSLAMGMGITIGNWPTVALAVAIILVMALVNYLGVVWGGLVQNITTIIKATGVALIAVSPWVVSLFGGDGIEPSNYSSTLTVEVAHENGKTAAAYSSVNAGDDRSTAARFGIILLAIMWAYNGWHGVTPVAEEIKDPEQNVPRALFGGIGILILLYFAANVAYHGVLSLDEMADAGEQSTEVMAEKLLGPTGLKIVSAIIMCSVFGAINSNLLLAPRVAFAMGRDGLFFRQLGHVHAHYRSPSVAIVVQALMAVALVVASGFLTIHVSEVTKRRIAKAIENESPEIQARITAAVADHQRRLVHRAHEAVGDEPQEVRDRIRAAIEAERTVLGDGWYRGAVLRLENKTIFELLTNFVIFAASIFYVLCVLAVLVLRWKEPERERPYRTLGYPLVPLAFLAFYSWFLVQVFRGEPFEAVAGLVLISLGLPVHWWWQWRSKIPTA